MFRKNQKFMAKARGENVSSDDNEEKLARKIKEARKKAGESSSSSSSDNEKVKKVKPDPSKNANESTSRNLLQD